MNASRFRADRRHQESTPSRRPRARHPGFATAATAALIALANGCAPRVSITVVPLGIAKLDPADVLTAQKSLDACYYWIDDHGRLCIAMRTGTSAGAIIGRPRAAVASLVLGPAPAGVGKNYRADKNTFRMIEHTPPAHERWASLAGIIALWRTDHTHLAGRFRIYAKHQQFHIAMGWHGNTRAVLVGEFRAAFDPIRGPAILRQSEQHGMQRTRRTKPKTRTPDANRAETRPAGTPIQIR